MPISDRKKARGPSTIFVASISLRNELACVSSICESSSVRRQGKTVRIPPTFARCRVSCILVFSEPFLHIKIFFFFSGRCPQTRARNGAQRIREDETGA